MDDQLEAFEGLLDQLLEGLEVDEAKKGGKGHKLTTARAGQKAFFGKLLGRGAKKNKTDPRATPGTWEIPRGENWDKWREGYARGKWGGNWSIPVLKSSPRRLDKDTSPAFKKGRKRQFRKDFDTRAAASEARAERKAGERAARKAAREQKRAE